MKGWQKCPSVTRGGKSFFFFYHPERKLWVVWERFCGAWRINHWPFNNCVDGTNYKTSTAAMKAAERIK